VEGRYSFTPRPLYALGKSRRYPLDTRLGGPQNWSGCGGGEKSPIVINIDILRNNMDASFGRICYATACCCSSGGGRVNFVDWRIGVFCVQEPEGKEKARDAPGCTLSVHVFLVNVLCVPKCFDGFSDDIGVCCDIFCHLQFRIWPPRNVKTTADSCRPSLVFIMCSFSAMWTVNIFSALKLMNLHTDLL